MTDEGQRGKVPVSRLITAIALTLANLLILVGFLQRADDLVDWVGAAVWCVAMGALAVVIVAQPSRRRKDQR